MNIEHPWWQKAVFYQIYPRSFADSNADGIGDLNGIRQKIDYLSWLGIDAVWLSPHFPSPMRDCGYDIADYRAVAPEYGTLNEFKLMLAELHAHGIRLVIDLVLNHTSDQHPWFLESRSSVDNPKRDWYIWAKGDNGDPPNNRNSTFGGPAWTLDKVTGEYYYHFFFREQPDLNWRNPEVKQAMFDEARFWLDMGVDGFRLDAIGTIFENHPLANVPLGLNLENILALRAKAVTKADHQKIDELYEQLFDGMHDLPEVHDLMKEFKMVVAEYPDRVLIGETDDVAFYGKGQDELDLNFNFPLMRTPRIDAAHVLDNQEKRHALLPLNAWPCNTLGNHDAARMLSEYGDGKDDAEIAKANLALVLSLWGTPFLYNGEEIGMPNSLIEDAGMWRDPLAHFIMTTQMKYSGKSEKEAIYLASLAARDKSRTPMHWANTENGGFSPPDVAPWLPVDPSWRSGVNVEEQMKSPDSLLSYYRRALNARKLSPALQVGSYRAVSTVKDPVLVFQRNTDAELVLVLINFNSENQPVVLNLGEDRFMPIFSGVARNEIVLPNTLNLQPFEVIWAKRVETEFTSLR
ncbi:MAG TPA: alpha-glucosidase [Bellilinea sp.]|nr:alpha-glucosidase [Bellilinea sp.]